MITAIALLSLLPASGVVRAVHGPVAIDGAAARPGELIAAGAAVETGADGFAELQLPRIGRVRLSAVTRMVVAKDELRLLSGRLWLQVGASQLAIQMVRHRAELAPRTSAIVERTTGGGSAIVVRAGKVTLMAQDGETRLIEEGQSLRVLPGVAKLPEPRVGGRGTGELVTVEARRAMNDPLGIEAFLLSRSLDAELRARAARRVDQLLRSSDVSGGEHNVFGNLVEEAFRPPPFFEAEVPPKGPNVRVEVEFGEE